MSQLPRLDKPLVGFTATGLVFSKIGLRVGMRVCVERVYVCAKETATGWTYPAMPLPGIPRDCTLYRVVSKTVAE